MGWLAFPFLGITFPKRRYPQKLDEMPLLLPSALDLQKLHRLQEQYLLTPYISYQKHKTKVKSNQGQFTHTHIYFPIEIHKN